MMRGLVIGVTLLAIVTGCAVGPNYVRPPVAAPDAYKETQGWKRAAPQADVLRGGWWEMFGDPQLNALEQQVDISNQNVAAAEAKFREAVALVREARAGYFPTVSIGVGVTRSRTSGGSGGRTTGNGTTVNDYTLPINASWEPDVWGKIRRMVESQRASAQASAADLESARLSARATLAQDYFLLRTQDAQQHLLTATVADFEKSLQLTKNQYEAGIVSRADVLQAETLLETTRAQAVDIGVQRAQLEHAIALLIGVPPSTFSLPPAPLAATPPGVPVGVPSELLERRPDVASAERAVAAANAQIGVEEAAYFPTITLSAQGGFESSSAAQWLAWPMRFWSIGGQVSETVYDAGLRHARTDE
ncbi:MAG TPA: efflux transporter outer membrane subunit, partial [Candidatus Binatia bacterium]|nr:efflux transporter outer membrane subunit [Candidatus Binatia bacterium]